MLNSNAIYAQLDVAYSRHIRYLRKRIEILYNFLEFSRSENRLLNLKYVRRELTSPSIIKFYDDPRNIRYVVTRHVSRIKRNTGSRLN